MQKVMLGPYDYDELRGCPFCHSVGLIGEAENCQHFVAAFQEGDWARDLCPPVFCDGFRFNRRAMLATLAEADGIVCKEKPGTRRHPFIETFFSEDPGLAAKIRAAHENPIVWAGVAECPDCGMREAVLGESGTLLCYFCGANTESIQSIESM